MKPILRLRHYNLVFAALAVAGGLQAQVSINGLGDLIYSENFANPGIASNSTGSITATWTNNVGYSFTDPTNGAQSKALTGWYRALVTDPAGPTYMATNTFIAAANLTTSNNPMMFMARANATLTDTAIGLRTSASTQAAMGMVFLNDTGAAITQAGISYTGEQWRREASATATQLDFQYKVVSNFDPATYNVWAETGWTDANALDFVSPSTGTSAANLLGNDPANSLLLADTLQLNLENGQYLLVRWLYSSADELDVAGNTLAVDDLTIDFNGTAVPEPSTLALLALVGTVVLWTRRRRG